MDFYAPWPPLAGLVGLLLLAATPLLAAADAPPSDRRPRLPAIDGARGFLALSVVLYHGAIYHRLLADGLWLAPPSAYYTLLGTGGVAGFFMITGYLFWSRAIAERGRLRWGHFYVGRLFRIAPLYLVMVALMLLLVFEGAGWRLRVAPLTLAGEIAPWLALGTMYPNDVNLHPATFEVTAGVSWSLRYEWLFYLALPALAFVATRRRLALACVVPALLVALSVVQWWNPSLLGAGDFAYVVLFLSGMASATLQANGWRAPLGDRASSVAVVGLAAAIFLTCRIAYAPRSLVLMGLAFYLVTSGCTLFGLLTCRAARRLGDVSYGIYLLQGLVMAAVFRFSAVRAYALASPLHHWLVVLGAMVALVGLATLAHVGIERPGIALGRRVAARLPLRRGVATA